MSDDQGWTSPDDTPALSDELGESTTDVPADEQDVHGEPQLDLSQAQVGQPPDEALAFNDFETSWTEGVA
jgi:hypothetical protein